MLLFIDNEALVTVLHKQSSKSKRLMILVRQFILLAMTHNIIFKAKHIQSCNNSNADSRRFRELARNADVEPVCPTEEFLSVIYRTKLVNC